MFFTPPLEPRNPELVIHKHLPAPSLIDVLKEKHVPFRRYLEEGEDLSQAQESYVSSNGRPMTAPYIGIGKVVKGSVKQKKKDFNLYDKITKQKRLEILELQRRSKIINERIRQVNR